MLVLVRATFTCLDEVTVPGLFTTLVSPHLEYGNVILSPRFKMDSVEVEKERQRLYRISDIYQIRTAWGPWNTHAWTTDAKEVTWYRYIQSYPGLIVSTQSYFSIDQDFHRQEAIIRSWQSSTPDLSWEVNFSVKGLSMPVTHDQKKQSSAAPWIDLNQVLTDFGIQSNIGCRDLDKSIKQDRKLNRLCLFSIYLIWYDNIHNTNQI